MESTITGYNETAQTITKTRFRFFDPACEEEEVIDTHKGRTIAYFLWTYAVIFTTIMTAVIIAERFFFSN